MTTKVGDGEHHFQAGSPPAPVFYAHLNSTERAKISAICTQSEQYFAQGGVSQLEQLVLTTELRLRPALLEQLLPIEIEYLTETHGGIPTLHELAVLYPNLEDLLAAAYPRLRSDVRLPDVLGVYRLVRVVGSGSQATIAIGRHKRLHQPVAIKFSRDEDSSRRLLQEAAFLSRLDGLNVPEVIDDGRTPDGTAFFIMKYLEGRNLLELISDRGPIRDPVTCARSLLQIAETLAQIHDRGILHRDLSPKNIHVGDDGIWRIVDFGLAIDVASGTASRQDVKEFRGTPAFMAPEQISGDGSVDGKLSDLYALGRLLLFVASGLDAVLTKLPESVADERTDHAVRRNPVIPHRTLARIQAKSTHPIPSQRYSSAAEMAGELKRFVQQTEHRRRWRRLLLRGAVVVVLGWGALWASRMIGDRREPTRSAEAEHSVNVAALTLPHRSRVK